MDDSADSDSDTQICRLLKREYGCSMQCYELVKVWITGGLFWTPEGHTFLCVNDTTRNRQQEGVSQDAGNRKEQTCCSPYSY